METTQLLNERGSTHGAFTDNARVSQALKKVLQSEANWNKLHDIHKEALEYICGKISRILAGDPTFQDNYDDISGYAQLPKKFNHGKQIDLYGENTRT
jgi:hypothetical protein